MSITSIFNGVKYSDTVVKDIPSNAASNSINSADIKAGSQLTGKVISSDNSSVTLDVNGKTINAKIDGNVNLTPGETVTFDVKGSGNNQVTLTPLYTNTANSSTAIKALSYANLPLTETSISMADSMINNNMNIDAKSLSVMYRQVSSFPETSPEVIVSMKKMGIEVNANNIESFQAFKNYESTVTEGINDVMNSIPDAFNELISRGDDGAFKSFALDILNMVNNSENMNEAIANESQSENILLENSNENGIITTDSKVMIDSELFISGNPEDGKLVQSDAVIDSSVNDNENVLLKNTLDGKTTVNQTDIVLITSNESNIENNIKSNNESYIGSNIISESKINDNNGNPSLNTSLNPSLNSSLETKDAWQLLSTADKSQIIDGLKTVGIDDNTLRQLYSADACNKDVIDLTRQILEKGQLTEKLKSVISSKNFGELLKDQIKNELLLEPKDVGHKETVQNLYRRLDEQVRTLTESLTNNSLTNTALNAKLSDMNNNLDFMNQMNNVYQYVQLPLKMAGSEATGDLYVYTDKKSLANNDGNVSALLHLDMDHLGPVDVYAAISPGNNVFTKFTVADDSILDFIESNIHILNERLSNRGYNMKYEAVTKAVINTDKTSENQTQTKIMKYSFDMKA